jgi:hypothetical protein
MRFFSRERTELFSRSRSRSRSQRGFVLAAALLIAVLYFALMELMMIDSTRSLQEAQRFRARIIAATLAENAVELAAAGMITKPGGEVQSEDAQGTMDGTLVRTGSNFELVGEASSKGVPPATAHVRLQGSITGNQVTIDWSTHSQ